MTFSEQELREAQELRKREDEEAHKNHPYLATQETFLCMKFYELAEACGLNPMSFNAQVSIKNAVRHNAHAELGYCFVGDYHDAQIKPKLEKFSKLMGGLDPTGVNTLRDHSVQQLYTKLDDAIKKAQGRGFS